LRAPPASFACAAGKATIARRILVSFV
jgi:hypothetical protein